MLIFYIDTIKIKFYLYLSNEGVRDNPIIFKLLEENGNDYYFEIIDSDTGEPVTNIVARTGDDAV
jgi:hypothetical protein